MWVLIFEVNDIKMRLDSVVKNVLVEFLKDVYKVFLLKYNMIWIDLVVLIFLENERK